MKRFMQSAALAVALAMAAGCGQSGVTAANGGMSSSTTDQATPVDQGGQVAAGGPTDTSGVGSTVGTGGSEVSAGAGVSGGTDATSGTGVVGGADLGTGVAGSDVSGAVGGSVDVPSVGSDTAAGGQLGSGGSISIGNGSDTVTIGGIGATGGGGGGGGGGSATTTATPSTSAWAATPPRFYLVELIRDNMGEMKLATMALSRSTDANVLAFAQMMLDEHMGAENAASNVARAEGIAMPSEPGTDAILAQDRLSRLEGDEFDEAWALAMVQLHAKAVAMSQAQAGGGGAIGDLAGDLLPTLREHLAEANDLVASLGVDATAGVALDGTSAEDDD